MSSSSLRAGVIGVGHLGTIHTKLWLQTDGAELVGVYDTDNQRGQTVADQYGVRFFSELDQLLAETDVVSIVTPTSTHGTIAERAIEQGNHCFIEKPITVRHDEAERITQLATRKNITVQVGHVERFNAALISVQNNIHDLRFIESHRLSQFSLRALDVSVVHDLMIHDIDLMLWLVKSEVKEVRASGVGVLSDSIDIANARIEFTNGCVANLTASRISQRPMRKMRLFARDSYISIDFAAPAAEIFTIGDDENSGADAGILLGALPTGTSQRTIRYRKPELPQINAIALELAEFVSAVNKQTPPPVTAADATEALRIAEEIVRLL